MANKQIHLLPEATSVGVEDLFVLSQGRIAKKLTGQTLLSNLAPLLDGHGGISDISYTPPSSQPVVSPSLKGALTITMADETAYTLEVVNGRGISNITWTESGQAGNGRTHTGTITYNDGTTSTVSFQDGLKGDTGPYTYVHFKWASRSPSADSDMSDAPGPYIGIYSGLSSTKPTSYTAYTWYQYKGEKGDTGSSIDSISGPSSSGLTDTYTIEMTDGATHNFNVTNGNGIASIQWQSNSKGARPGVPGSYDTYLITFDSGSTTTFNVYNGADGEGASLTVDGIPSIAGDVSLLTIGAGAPTVSTPGNVKSRYFDALNSTLYICIAYDSTTGTYTWQGAGVTVDTAFSTTSTNPVQNKVITGKVGTGTLNTTAQNLTGAVNEVLADIPSPYSSTPSADTSSGAAGVSSAWARGDHKHPLNVATTGTPTNDGTGSLGSATTYARTDHVHPLNVDSTAPADLGTAAAGSATVYAKRDHVHNLPSVAASISVGTLWTDSGSGYYTQTVTVTGATVTANSKVDIQPDVSTIQTLTAAGVSSCYVGNNNGTLTFYAVGGAPSALFTVQCVVTEVRA